MLDRTQLCHMYWTRHNSVTYAGLDTTSSYVLDQT